MKQTQIVAAKIMIRPELIRQVARWRFLGKNVVFTNGVFDILHSGHIASLSQAATEGDFLVVGINADASVKRLKGEGRPVNDENARALIIASLALVDAVVIFEEDTPGELIKAILPEVLVKGGDYTIDTIVGATEVVAAGGRVVINPILDGFSTTDIIDRMKKS